MKRFRAVIIVAILVVSLASAFPAQAKTEELPPPAPVLLSNDVPVLWDNSTQEESQIEISADASLVQLTPNASYSLTITKGAVVDFRSSISTTGTFTVIEGTVYTNDNAITAPAIFLGEYTQTLFVSVSLGASAIVTDCWAVRGSDVALDAGTSTITTTLLFDNAAKIGRKYNNLTVKDKGSIYGYMEGKSEFNTLTIDSVTPTYIADDITIKESKGRGLLTIVPIIRATATPVKLK